MSREKKTMYMDCKCQECSHLERCLAKDAIQDKLIQELMLDEHIAYWCRVIGTIIILSAMVGIGYLIGAGQ